MSNNLYGHFLKFILDKKRDLDKKIEKNFNLWLEIY